MTGHVAHSRPTENMGELYSNDTLVTTVILLDEFPINHPMLPNGMRILMDKKKSYEYNEQVKERLKHDLLSRSSAGDDIDIPATVSLM
jgi:hypothetical protein